MFSLKFAARTDILLGTPMTPTVLVAIICVALAVAAFYAFRRASRQTGSAYAELGMVSSRWISELRRDEPWTRS